MWSRRSFIRVTGGLGTAALASRIYGIAEVQAATAAVANRTPEDVAQDEFYWREIQQAFTLDRTLVNLNNGNSCPSPRVVHEALKRYLDSSNQAPVYHRTLLEQNRETARRRLALEFGCEAEELAVTRNASEALQIAQNGIDLEPGDEVITTEQDYGRMLTTWDQRERRHKIKVTKLNFPVPTTTDELYQRFERAITPRTKILHFCHITNLTGQLFPVQRLARLARQRGILTIVDGAHAVAHFPYKIRDLECDYYGTSLHKWLLAPHNTGFLFVRKENIERTWPLQAAPARRNTDIRKFEEVGTISAAPYAAINEALAFHQAIGAERKAARLRYLTMRWVNALKTNPRVKIHSDLAHTYGLANVQIQGLETAKVQKTIWDRYRIITVAIVREDYQGLRVTPNVYTTIEEIDEFILAMNDVLKNGLPAESA